MPRAVYPGSFDPITYGHIDIVQRAKTIFDELIVAVVTNPSKQTLFSLEERRKLCEQALKDEQIDGIQVITWEGLVIECAKRYQAQAIIRGLRANSDFEREFQMALTNRDLNGNIESVFFMTSGEYSFLNSSIVKEIKSFRGDVSRFVPSVVEKALEQKFRKT
ncbi:MAG: pantetheine-phosphate adenylyltransferase [Candidatus Fraserbacteria bacterium RBG_16_55_9]|uniref:Phosphopantetheine adenylyltransferase n=1 Tax=Fraserbacteria sp. (strain RBG_16_55_9) TaxID=1817864 RepID=A0A1F5UX39_FRAXR|nr:MAG: pantetheine-phosphate adenylyltransferase [Candidatus Fraserbacteria bacterium RBG_16_55_9]